MALYLVISVVCSVEACLAVIGVFCPVLFPFDSRFLVCWFLHYCDSSELKHMLPGLAFTGAPCQGGPELCSR